MATIPPWLNISPGQFLQAMQAGAALGLQLSQQRQRDQQEPIRRGGGIPVRGGYTPPAPVAPPAVATGDGFSADRLSYSVADDIGAIAGEKAAADEARQAYNATLQNPLVDRTRFQEILSPEQRIEQKRRELELQGKIAEKKALDAIEASKPIFRTSGDNLVRIDPVTGKAESIFTAPKPREIRSIENQLVEIPSDGGAPEAIYTAPRRPGGSALQQLLAESGPAAPTVSNRIPVISPDGKPGTVSQENLAEALAAGYKRR